MNLSQKIVFEELRDNYPSDILASIWKESLPDIDGKKRIQRAYQENNSGKARVWLLKDEATGGIFGCSALLPRTFFLKGEKRKAAIIADTAIKKEYRSLGPSLALHEKILNNSKDFDLILAFPNKIAEAVIQRVGFRKAGNLAHYLKIIKSKIIIEKKAKISFVSRTLMFLSPLMDFGLKILDLRRGLRKKLYGIHLDDFDEKFDCIWNKFRRKFDFAIDRSSEYLKWRYQGSPSRNYEIYGVFDLEKHELFGYFIYYLETNRVYVDDFLWLDDFIKLEDFLSFFARYMRKKGMTSISFKFMENKKITKSFKKSSFFKVEVAPIFYFVLNESTDGLFSEALTHDEVFLTSGDHDYHD